VHTVLPLTTVAVPSLASSKHESLQTRSSEVIAMRTTSSNVTRREFLQLTGLCAGALLAWRPGAAVASPARAQETLEIELRAGAAEVGILPGAPTRVLTYQARVLAGDPAQVQTIPGSYLGPVIRARRGQRLRVNFKNDLAEDSTVHFHGITIPAHMAGHPHGTDIVHEGGSFVYEFDILDRAGPYFFHPHPHMRIGYQVYHGLAGLLMVTDDEEAGLGLPDGAQEVPLVIQDRVFDADNQMIYTPNGMGMGPAMMTGFMGNRILVNGRPDYVLDARPGPYRLRLFNGSNARTYKLGWGDSSPFTVIGTDGGLLRAPVQRPYLMLAPGERLDLWVDFTGRAAGAELVLQGLPHSAGMGMMGGMGMGMMGGMGRMGGMRGRGRMRGMGGMPGGDDLSDSAFPILRVRIDGEPTAPRALPQALSALAPLTLREATNVDHPRTFRLTMMHMDWLINGRSFVMDEIADDEKVPLDTVEVWQMVNASPIAHPMHIHNTQFNVIERSISAGSSSGYESVRGGFVDDGWKDTVWVMPGETVKFLVKFSTYSGMYMYHCHILEHEDMGMMRNLMVGSSDGQSMPDM
jgi:blue copper oxidase